MAWEDTPAETSSSLATGEKAKAHLDDFATLLSFALRSVTQEEQESTYQPLGIHAPQKLVHLMASPESVCTFPSLQLHQKTGQHAERQQQQQFSCSSKPVLADAAAANLRKPLTRRGNELETVPLTLLWNISRSLASLAQARLRSTVQALQARPADGARSKLVLELLSSQQQQCKDPLQPNTIVTSFQTTTSTTGESSCTSSSSSSKQQQPLLFHCVMDLQVLGEMVTIQLEAPGTLGGSWVTADAGCERGLFDAVELVLDTEALLTCMVRETKRLIRRAVSVATQIAACMTRTLPSNAPHGLIELRQRLLRQQRQQPHYHRSPGLSPDVLQREVERQEALRDGKTTPATNAAAAPSPLPFPHNESTAVVDSTRALEECFTMPPPPARRPGTVTASRRDSSGCDDGKRPRARHQADGRGSRDVDNDGNKAMRQESSG